MVRLLLERGLAPGSRSAKGLTALHYAVHSGNVETVRVLEEAGADFHAADQVCVTVWAAVGILGKWQVRTVGH